MERQRIGQAAEDAAVEFLRAQGVTVLFRNYRFRLGELDVVACDGAALIIVEVRTRTSERFGGAAASVDHRKQSKLRRAADLLLQRHTHLRDLPVRFDVVVVKKSRVEWIKHAFT